MRHLKKTIISKKKSTFDHQTLHKDSLKKGIYFAKLDLPYFRNNSNECLRHEYNARNKYSASLLCRRRFAAAVHFLQYFYEMKM